jgi:hypothetical protein
VFNERKTKLTLLSLLSAVAVMSTAFAGISIYAQTDGSNTTTFEEQAQNGTEGATTAANTTSSGNDTSASSTNGDTSTADVKGLFDGLVVCDVGTAEVNGQTQTASVDNSTLCTPTVSVKVMTETEVAAAAGNETGTASTSDTSTASAGCKMLGEGTSTSGNATGSAMSTGNATSTGNTTSSLNTTSTSGNTTSTAASDATDSNRQILVIDGQDFAPGQVVLIFSDNQLVGIDDVDGSGNIEAKIPEPHAGSSTGTSTAGAGTDLRFVESGTLRSGTFSYDGQTLTSAGQGDVQAEGTTTSSTDNATSSAAGNSSSSTTNSTDNSTMQ